MSFPVILAAADVAADLRRNHLATPNNNPPIGNNCPQQGENGGLETFAKSL
jgi:hypothetical protein